MNFRVPFFALTIAVSILGFGAQANEPAGDVERGKTVFKACKNCHMIGADARNRIGPPLNNILSAPAATVDGFKYSKAMQQAALDGLRWTTESLDRFLENPKAMIPRTKMNFRGLKKPQDRSDLIAYLATFGAGETAAGVEPTFSVSPEILALEGDPEYGEYLASECTTCHQADGDNEGIPSIIGLETEDFVTAMYAYKEKHRENPVMQLVTGRLSSDEIAALAAYFKSLTN